MNMDIDKKTFVVSEGRDYIVIVCRDFVQLLKNEGLNRIDAFLNPAKGEKLRDVEKRSNIKLILEGRTFFLKRHQASSPLDRVRSLFGRAERLAPGMVEFKNIMAIEQNGFPVMKVAACGEKRSLGLFGESFIMTEEIEGAEPLDNYFKKQFAPPLTREKLLKKRDIINRLGELIRKFHALGFNHRDLYMCHIFVRAGDHEAFLYIIDLQRMQTRKALRGRWLVKDIAHLNYSSQFEGITDTDRMRFLRSYRAGSHISESGKGFIKKVVAKTNRMVSRIEKRKRRASRKVQ